MTEIISKLLADRHRLHVGGIMTDRLDPASKSLIYIFIGSLITGIAKEVCSGRYPFLQSCFEFLVKLRHPAFDITSVRVADKNDVFEFWNDELPNAKTPVTTRAK